MPSGSRCGSAGGTAAGGPAWGCWWQSPGVATSSHCTATTDRHQQQWQRCASRRGSGDAGCKARFTDSNTICSPRAESIVRLAQPWASVQAAHDSKTGCYPPMWLAADPPPKTHLLQSHTASVSEVAVLSCSVQPGCSSARVHNRRYLHTADRQWLCCQHNIPAS